MICVILHITIDVRSSSEDAFGQIVKVTEPVGNELDLFKAKEPEKGGRELRIVEIESLETLFR